MMSQKPDTHESNASEALKILNQKRLSQNGKEKIGLVVQGGGMRAVYSMGALAALEEMGFGQCFDHVAGSSAGALNGAYFITGQAGYGVETYVNHLTHKNFVNPLRVKKMLDIDYLVDHIGKKARRLDIEKLRSAHTMLHIPLTEFSNGKARYVTNRTPGIDLWEVFRASAAVPILYNKPVKVGDGLYVDGSLSDRVPIRRVMDYGCRYIVVILTMPYSHRIKTRNAFLKSISWPATRHYSDAVRQALLGEDLDYNNMMSDLSRRNPRISGYSNRVVVITPQHQPERFSSLTANPEQLMQCALTARSDTWKAFGKTPPRIKNPFGM
jgi:predicted patatin/cPLA2 family phospholipase